VLPVSAITCPAATASPGFTRFSDRCRNLASVPSVYCTSIQLPFAFHFQLARVTVPASGDLTGVPTGVLKSMPLCDGRSLSSEVIWS
jgi:hypothetical protein